jgi:hypothetical protein
MSFVVDAIKDIGRWIDDEIWEPIKDVGSVRRRNLSTCY